MITLIVNLNEKELMLVNEDGVKVNRSNVVYDWDLLETLIRADHKTEEFLQMKRDLNKTYYVFNPVTYASVLAERVFACDITFDYFSQSIEEVDLKREVERLQKAVEALETKFKIESDIIYQNHRLKAENLYIKLQAYMDAGFSREECFKILNLKEREEPSVMENNLA